MNSTPITANATTMAGSESQRAAILDSYGYLALRLAAGFVFAMHGWQKLTIMGIGGVAGFFGSLGITPQNLWRSP